MLRGFSWAFLSFLLFVACGNSDLTKEQEDIKQLSEELESVKIQLEEVVSQIDKTNQELNQIDIKLNAGVRVESKPVGGAENSNELKPQEPEGEVNRVPVQKPLALDLEDMVLIPPYIIEVNEEDVFNGVGDLIVPARKVKVTLVPSFYIDKYEVTVGQFREFLKMSGYKPHPPINWNAVFKISPNEDHPMVCVSPSQSRAYAEWVGKRLPSNEEWEIAALGGTRPQKGIAYFSWGKESDDPDSVNESRMFSNWEGVGGKDIWDTTTAPVGSFKPNGYGLYDISGNVFELTVSTKGTAAKVQGDYIWRGGGYLSARSYKNLWPGLKVEQVPSPVGDLVVSWGEAFLSEKNRTISVDFSDSGKVMGFRCVADLR